MAKVSILVVDDEAGVRTLAVRILQREGYRVLEAAAATEACALFAAHRDDIAVLVTDVVMPDMDGPALAQRLVGDQPALRVVFMSGYTAQIACDLGGGPRVRFLAKPFRAAELVATVTDVLADSPAIVVHTRIA